MVPVLAQSTMASWRGRWEGAWPGQIVPYSARRDDHEGAISASGAIGAVGGRRYQRGATASVGLSAAPVTYLVLTIKRSRGNGRGQNNGIMVEGCAGDARRW
jgi:hypothetical protein